MNKLLPLALALVPVSFLMDCRINTPVYPRQVNHNSAYRSSRINFPPPDQEERMRQRNLARTANIEWIKTETRKYSPDSWALLMRYEELPASASVPAVGGGLVSTRKSDETFRYLRGRTRLDMLTSMEKNIHEIAHGYFDQNVYNYLARDNSAMDPHNAQGYIFISPSRGYFVSFPLKAMFPSRELARSIPADLRTFRFNTYIEGITSTQSEGVIGLLNELQAYYLGSRYCYEMLDAYKDAAGAGHSGLFEWVTSTQSTMSAFYEFDYYIKEYLLYMKQTYPDNYLLLKSYKPFSEAYRNVRMEYSNLVDKYSGRVRSEIRKMNSSGRAAARMDKGWLWVKASRSNVESGTPVFSDPREKLMPLLESRKYSEVEKDFSLK